MAIQETRTRPAPFVEQLGQDLATQVPANTRFRCTYKLHKEQVV